MSLPEQQSWNQPRDRHSVKLTFSAVEKKPTMDHIRRLWMVERVRQRVRWQACTLTKLLLTDIKWDEYSVKLMGSS